MKPSSLLLRLVGVLVCGGSAALPAAESKPPNILFILADDWGWGDLGCYGHRQMKTPRLDQLARQGILFTQFYVNGSVCSPSRAAFLTSKFPARLGLHGHLATAQLNKSRAMPNELDPSVQTLPRLLQQAGYATGHFGKWHLGGVPIERYGFAQSREAASWGEGTNLWAAAHRPRSTEFILEETRRFIEQHKDQPFYVQAWLLDLHATLFTTEEQMAPYRNLLERNVPFKSPGQIYYGAATEADRQIGRLLDRLDELGLRNNTMVVFSADNGPEDMAIRNAAHSGVGSAGPFRGRKRSLYEGGVRVPFILRWPASAPAGRVDDTTVLAGVDWLPTLCQLVGVKLPEGLALDGEDMSKAFRGQAQSRAKALMWEWRFNVFGHTVHRSPILSIREGQWKLLLNADRSRVELYDIPADPTELNNLAEHHAGLVDRLAEQVISWQATLPKGPMDATAGANAYPWPKR